MSYQRSCSGCERPNGPGHDCRCPKQPRRDYEGTHDFGQASALLFLLCVHCGGDPFELGDPPLSVDDAGVTIDAANAPLDVDADKPVGKPMHDAGSDAAFVDAPGVDAAPTVDAAPVVDGAPDDVEAPDAGPALLCCVHSTGAPAICGDVAWYCCASSTCQSTAACGATYPNDGGPACVVGAMCGVTGSMPTGTVAFCH